MKLLLQCTKRAKDTEKKRKNVVFDRKWGVVRWCTLLQTWVLHWCWLLLSPPLTSLALKWSTASSFPVFVIPHSLFPSHFPFPRLSPVFFHSLYVMAAAFVWPKMPGNRTPEAKWDICGSRVGWGQRRIQPLRTVTQGPMWLTVAMSWQDVNDHLVIQKSEVTA